MVLCRFFSRTVGNCEETETTEGLDRRPRELEESLLSLVDSVELLADDECLLSVAEAGGTCPVLCSAHGSPAISCLNGWSILVGVYTNAVYLYVYYIYHAAIIRVPKKTRRKVTQYNAMQCHAM